MSVKSRHRLKRREVCRECKELTKELETHPFYCDECLEKKAKYLPTPEEIEVETRKMREKRLEDIRKQAVNGGEPSVFVPRVYKVRKGGRGVKGT